MTEERKKKRFFTKHAKSSAALVSLGIHAVLILVALSFVAVTVIQKEDQDFVAKKVSRPKMQLKKLQVPVKVKKSKPKPKLRKRVLVKNVRRKTPEIKMPEITGVKGGIGGGAGDGFGGGDAIGFSMPEIDFFGAKAKGEKVCFIVHFGPATINKGDQRNPYTRMTGYVIRKRLEDLVNSLPEYTLFNVACYWMNDTWAMSPEMLLATPANKQKVMDWMAPVNPLEGKYDHCFSNKPKSVEGARKKYPTKVENLPFYAPKWVYPYIVPKAKTLKYLSDGKDFEHWNRAVAWAILEQKPDTVFILTTNYIDGWGGGNKGEPNKIMAAYKKMFRDLYGPDRKRWPTINVVVLKHSGDPDQVLNGQFGPIWRGTGSSGSVIHDITKYMTDDETDLYKKYRSEYGSGSGK